MGVRVHIFHPKIAPQALIPAQPSQPGVSAGLAISRNAMDQIGALILEKQSRTPEQKKISSQFLATHRMLQGRPVAKGVPNLETGVELDDNNNFLADIRADVSNDLLNRLRTEGVIILKSYKRYHSILAFIPPDRMEEIAGWPDVHFIGPRAKATTNTIISEGDKTHEADIGRSTFGVDGTGVKVGVISNDVTSLADSQSLGELGQVTVLPGQTGTCSSADRSQHKCDEGTAMLEIIHDLAPGASLYFATAGPDISSMAQNILDLRAAGCDIIVDDISYHRESPFQDGQTYFSDSNGGIITQAVNEVVADGALYFSSAANSGNQDDSTSGTYEGDFVDSGTALIVNGTDMGEMNVFSGVAIADPITKGSGRDITLFWSDPLGGSSNDYDLYIIDPTGSSVVDYSNSTQSGSQDPVEEVDGYANVTGYLVMIVKYSGSARFLHLTTNRGELMYATSGATFGHNAARNAFSVAATPAYLPFLSGYPMGPYPSPFNNSNVVEPFSSDGPRRIFFHSDGTPITPGNYLSSGGELLQKPDFTAADGVSVSGAGNFSTPFYGTSAAAPHAAAIAALIKSAVPGISNTDIRNALLDSAIDIMSPGGDRDSGKGIIMAYAALNAVSQTGDLPNLTPYKPPTWSDKIVVSNVTGTNTDNSPLYTTDTLYVDWAAANNGSAETADGFYSYLYVDRVLKAKWYTDPPLSPPDPLTHYAYADDYSIGSLSAGTHTIKIVVDQTSAIPESSEADNEYTKTITVFNPGECSSISQSVQNFSSSSGTGSFNVTASDGCPWTAVNNDSWIIVTGGSSGTGNGKVSFAVSANGTGEMREGTITVGGQTLTVMQAKATFADVTDPSHWAYSYIYGIYNAGLTGGCSPSPLQYCPDRSVTRAEMSVFLERGKNGSTYVPPAASGVFSDVSTDYWAADWIEQLYAEGITGGCWTSPLQYCPERDVTRAEMAVFLLRSEHGRDYTPPSAKGIFEDVPINYWAADWIEQLYAEGITGGCWTSPLQYCPDRTITRAEMSVFLVRTFLQ